MEEQLVVLGDSVTVGAGFSGVPQEATFVSLLKEQFRKLGMGIRLIASALDGVDTFYALKRFERMVTRLAPDMVTIALGLNDAKPLGSRPPCPPDCFERNLSQLVEKTLAIDAQPILTTPPPRIDLPGESAATLNRMAAYADVVHRVAECYHAPVIELYEVFAHRDDLSLLLPDRLHPNADGHRIIARQFAQTLVPLCGQELKQRARRPYPARSDITA